MKNMITSNEARKIVEGFAQFRQYPQNPLRDRLIHGDVILLAEQLIPREDRPPLRYFAAGYQLNPKLVPDLPLSHHVSRTLRRVSSGLVRKLLDPSHTAPLCPLKEAYQGGEDYRRLLLREGNKFDGSEEVPVFLVREQLDSEKRVRTLEPHPDYPQLYTWK
jgi:hypothetical protein